MTGFTAPALLRNGHVQSVVSSFRPREVLIRRRARSVINNSTEHTLDCGSGVRLQGFYTPPKTGRTKAIVMLIHGWEGCADSLYLLSCAQALHEAGFEIFRLNLRDHGGTQHLNRGLFHSCRIEDVMGALEALQALFPSRLLLVGGFSLGGNFALRAALRAPAASLNLGGVVAISPVLDPEQTLIAMEQGWFLYQHYFMRRWRRSLKTKHACFPDEYDIDVILKQKNIRDLTSYLAREHAGFDSLFSYLRGYSIVGDELDGLSVRAHILTALDDPIIPATGLAQLARPTSLHISASPNGGHCGFLEDYRLNGWTDREVCRLFTDMAGQP